MKAVRSLPQSVLVSFSELVAERLGLHFPRERLQDLERGLHLASADLGFPDSESCAQQLLARPLVEHELKVLAHNLTIGETYFLRDYPQLEYLAEIIAKERRRYIWCAGCCSGEEPYSIAVLLDRLIPLTGEATLEILATDINLRFLHKAKAGVFSEWSFRNAPAWLKSNYFNELPHHRYEIAPRIRKMVRFDTLNLASDPYPSADVIVCRNVLMYFSPEQNRKAVRRFFSALSASGALVLSSTEASPELSSLFKLERSGDALIYRKGARVVPDQTHFPLDQNSFESARRPEVASQPQRLVPEEPSISGSLRRTHIRVPQRLGHSRLSAADQARRLADAGDLLEALDLTDQAIEENKIDATLHYLRAVILRELDRSNEYAATLRRVIYLEPDFVLAHFNLGQCSLTTGAAKEALRHFGTALSLLSQLPAEAVVPGSDGLSAGRLRELIKIAVAGVARNA